MKIKSTLKGALLTSVMMAAGSAVAQSGLYPQNFNLREVTLLESPYKSAMEKNIEHLLQYDMERLLTPFIRQAGLSATMDESSRYYKWETNHPNFENWCWNPSFALDGHIGGHYLTALCLAYNATSDSALRVQLKSRIDFMIDVFDDCQSAYDNNTEGLYGFIGGLPDNSIWTELYKGNTNQFRYRGAWVPNYVMHKIYAGLRDAYVYMSDEKALKCFRKLCDWGINVVAALDDARMQNEVLFNEHGGVNEVYADAYKLFGDEKYLIAAKKYSHNEMIIGMQDGYNNSFLDHKHANTQVPKYIGFERISQEDHSAHDHKCAAHNFWEDVVNERTVCIGGNSVEEHFMAKSQGASYIHKSDGPESCNTNNMLKLSENLFCDTHDAKYIDFYEKAMLNHILSTQDPKTGGYVYFTSLRPQTYRVYSTVNSAMWCCVGTGMENHSKYGHFIYTHSEDNSTLFINLFTASELNSEKFSVKQETGFPFDAKSKITVNKSGNYTIAVRKPSWTTSGYKVTVNNEDMTGQTEINKASFVKITRSWLAGDVINVDYPMALTLSECPDYTDYVSFNYGPVLLAVQTTGSNPDDADYEELLNEYAGEGRMDHAPGVVGLQKNLTSAPMVLGERQSILERITTKDLSKLLFEIDVTRDNSEWTKLELKPFYSIHNARYTVYFNQQTEQAYAESDLAQEEAAAIALEERTLDKVATGEQQSEAGHEMEATNPASKGMSYGEYFRDAWYNDYFQYTLSTNSLTEDISLMVRYNINDRGRIGIIYIDGEKLRDVTIPQNKDNIEEQGFYNVEYPIAQSYLTDEKGQPKKSVVVKFQATDKSVAPGVYYVRLLKDYSGPQYYSFNAAEWVSADESVTGKDNITYDNANNTLSISPSSTNNISLQINPQLSDAYYIDSKSRYFIINASGISVAGDASYISCFNGKSKNISAVPSFVVKSDNDNTLLIWDINDLSDALGDDITISKSNGEKVISFELKKYENNFVSVLSDINFYSAESAADKYSELLLSAKHLRAI